MTTSGTIGSTVIDTVKVIDHAVRRCGLSPATLTPEQVESCTENLYMILTSIVNRGVNLWCIDRQLIGLQENQSSYDAPAGTVDILNVSYRTGTPLAFTADQDPSSYKINFTTGVPVKVVGMYFNLTRVNNFVFEVSNDGSDGSWSIIKTLPEFIGYSGIWYWYDIDPSYSTGWFRIREVKANPINAPVSFSAVTVMEDAREITLYKMSRDTYTSIPSKGFSGRPTEYLFDKQITPKITVYPVPNDVFAHLVVTRHRHVQDVGSLQNKLEIPERWFECIVWMLAQSCAFELPDVDPSRATVCIGMAKNYLLEAENGETDGSPIFLQPKISGYTV